MMGHPLPIRDERSVLDAMFRTNNAGFHPVTHIAHTLFK